MRVFKFQLDTLYRMLRVLDDITKDIHILLLCRIKIQRQD